MTQQDTLHDAAPDLLAALRGLLPHVPVPAVPLGDALCDDPCPLPDYIRAAHDAIAKATGKDHSQSTPELLAAASANAALLHIQTGLAVTGDFASIYFDGDRWNLLTSILADYIRAEIERGQS